MANLPNEIIDQILQQVHRSSRDTLISCMRCNSKFFAHGYKALYRHVALRIKDAPRFERAIRYYADMKDEVGDSMLSVIRTLRIIIPGDGRDYGYGGTSMTDDGQKGVDRVADRGIESLCRVLPLLTKLRSFSIVSYNGHRLNTFDDCLGHPQFRHELTTSARRKPGPTVNMLARLVEALPESIRDLSIDLSELSRYDVVPKCELCPAINKMAPRLEHLNLHLRSYCRGLLTAESPLEATRIFYPTLQTVIMRIHGFNARYCTRQIPPPPNPNNPWTSHTSSVFLNVDRYTVGVLNIISQTRAPNLKQFIIISKRRPHGIKQHSDAKWTVYVRELVSKQTAAIPRIFIDSRTPSPGNTFIQSARTTIRLPTDCNFINPHYWGKEYIGKSGSIRRFVEGRAGWVLFAHGPHIPGMRQMDVQNAIDAGYEIRAPPPSLVSEFRKQDNTTCQLWMDEDAAGTRLLEAAVWDGVLDSKVIARHEYHTPTIDAGEAAT